MTMTEEHVEMIDMSDADANANGPLPAEGPGTVPAGGPVSPDLIEELMAKGSFFGVNLSTPDLDTAFERIVAGGAEVVQEPTDQPYGVRDCAIRDPSGNMIRIQEV